MSMISATIVLFFVMDPLGNIPVFTAILSHVDPKRRQIVLIRELIIALVFLVGFVFGVISAVIAVTLQAEQGISGIGLYLFGLGMSSLLFKMLIGSVESVSGFPNMAIPGLSQIPIIGPIFFNQNLFYYFLIN